MRRVQTRSDLLREGQNPQLNRDREGAGVLGTAADLSRTFNQNTAYFVRGSVTVSVRYRDRLLPSRDRRERFLQIPLQIRTNMIAVDKLERRLAQRVVSARQHHHFMIHGVFPHLRHNVA